MPHAPLPLPAPPPRPWWIWLNVLGLDSVLAALCWMPLFARATDAQLVRAEYIVLGCAVWCVYAVDRIMDGGMAGGRRGERHLFALRRWPLLLAGVLLATGVSGWLLAFEVREIVLRWGVKFLAVIGFYFAVTWMSRRDWTGLAGAGGLAGLVAIGLMQGASSGVLWAQIWRGAFAGFLITAVYSSARQAGTPAPWVLPRKLLGGWLFATGTALASYAHREGWPNLFLDSQVVLFGVVCGLNSLGIRLWETERADLEATMLSRLYPWMILTAAAGAGMEWSVADRWTRPLFAACGAAALLLLALHATRHRTPVAFRRALADAAVIVPALAVIWL